VADQVFPWHKFQAPSGSRRHLPTDLLDAHRHLGARIPMFPSKLVKVGDRAVANGGQLDTFSLRSGLEKVPEIHNAKLLQRKYPPTSKFDLKIFISLLNLN
jgi:hypothetical protein